mgnify:CR=1 FL=1
MGKNTKIAKNVDLLVGTEGYPDGRCVARSQSRMYQTPDAPFEDLRCRLRVVPGYRVCRFHGANPANHGGHPVVTGKYSKFTPQHLAVMIEEYRNDPRWANLLEEISVLRALLSDYLNRHQEDTYDEDVQRHVANVADKISQLVERKHKIDYGEQYTLNIYAIQAYAARIADVINTRIVDENLRSLIVEDLGSIVPNDGMLFLPPPASAVVEDVESQ